MLRFCAAALSASLLFASSLGAQASSVEAEWLMSRSAEMTISAETPATAGTAKLLSLEERSERTASADPAVLEEDAVAAALAPVNFLDPHESETFALISADLAAVAETTGSIIPSSVPDAEMAAWEAQTLEAARTSDGAEIDPSTLLP